jgi:hypothetical protein
LPYDTLNAGVPDTLAAEANCIASTPDGNYIISGAVGSPWLLSGAHGWIVKIDPSGDTLWTRLAGRDVFNMLGTVIAYNNKYIAVGLNSNSGNIKQGWILEYDQNGNKLVDKTYGGTKNDALGDITPTGTGSFLALGYTQTFATNNTQDAWLVKFNSVFDTVWTKHYDLGAITGDSSITDNGDDITPFGNNTYLMTINSCKTCNGDGIAWYCVIDSSGNIISGSTHVFKKGPKNVFAGVKPTSDGGAIIAGSKSDSTLLSIYDNMWIVKLNSNADTVWSKVYGKAGIYSDGYSIYQTPDGGYFMSASSQIGDTPSYNFDNVWMMRLNSVGDTIQVCRWGGPNNDDLLDIIPAFDGGAIGAGVTNSVSDALPIPGKCDYLIMKTDCNNIAGIPDAVNTGNNINIFPNPANDEIQVISNQLSVNSIEVYNLLGERIYSSPITDNRSQVTINIADFSRGVYVLEIKTEKEVMMKKFVKD